MKRAGYDSFSPAAPKEQQGIHPRDTVSCAGQFSDSWAGTHEPEITIYLGQKSYSIRRRRLVQTVALSIENKLELIRHAEFRKNGTEVISNCRFGYK